MAGRLLHVLDRDALRQESGAEGVVEIVHRGVGKLRFDQDLVRVIVRRPRLQILARITAALGRGEDLAFVAPGAPGGVLLDALADPPPLELLRGLS